MKKAIRWFNKSGDRVFIYDAPVPEDSRTVSVIMKKDLAHFQRQYMMVRTWNGEDDSLEEHEQTD